MRDLGRRSLISIGSSYAVTLPKDWVRRVEGGKVRIVEGSSGELIILPAKGPISKVSIDLRGIEEGLWEIIAAYLDGYDEIEVRKERIKREDLETLRKALSKLIGMEILEEGSSRILLRCLMNHSSAKPMELLLRMKSIISGMISDLRDAIAEGDRELMSIVAERDDEVDKIYFALVRSIRRAMRSPEIMGMLGIDPINLLDMRIAAMIMELIADNIVELAQSDCDCTDLLREISDLFDRGVRSFELKDFREALEVRERVNEIIRDMPAEKSLLPLINILFRIEDLCDLVSPRFL